MVPFRLTVVAWETPPAPSNVIVPTPPPVPTGQKATIQPVVVMPNDPAKLPREHESSEESPGELDAWATGTSRAMFPRTCTANAKAPARAKEIPILPMVLTMVLLFCGWRCDF